ncbi:MAG: hypothetical protein GWO38_27230 [Phycisphaerae bacterium]|nr:hypothetical protein [Phycisphaerae bacterium]NIX01482.1 hypothetical protein [Phycisphaerae bacterium]NIX31219.1 hypothetical protein [Phycisphaerae bacterium]
MTKVTIQTRNDWAKRKIASAINTEAELLQKAIARIRDKLQDFEARYGKLDREALYGKIDDMELLEWEGEIEVLERLRERLKSLEEITFEYK